MKAFLNLLIISDAYDDADALEDAVLAALEAEGFKIPWHKSKEAED